MGNLPSVKSNLPETPSRLRAWLLAIRPKTLAGAMAPVLLGMAFAWRVCVAPSWQLSAEFYHNPLSSDAYTLSRFLLFIIPSVLCLLFAIIMQIDANLINDYVDYRKGTDRADRLGPPRACAQGWISPRGMLAGIVLTTLLASFVGLLILLWALQYELLLVGLLCILFSFLYTTHLSYVGMGDLLVLVFFGIVPVGFTYYVITTGGWTLPLTIAGLGMGLATDTLLMVNNYRDREQDAVSGKNTVVVRLLRRLGRQRGAAVARSVYLWLGLAAVLLAALVVLHGGRRIFLLLPYLLLHLHTYSRLCRLEGRELNGVLGATARNIFLYGLLFSACMV